MPYLFTAAELGDTVKERACNLMDVPCIFHHWGQVCTVECIITKRRKENASLVIGGPAWAFQLKTPVDLWTLLPQSPSASFSTLT